MQLHYMLRSRSSGLLPVTHSCTFPRPDSRLGLTTLRRKSGLHRATLQRLLVYLLLTVMLAGSMYGVVTIGRPGNAARSDDFLLGGGGALLDGGAGAAALPQRRHHGQKQQQRGRHAHQQGRQRAHAAGWDVRVHGEASGRRAAAEQPGGGALAGASRSSLEQQRLQQQRDRERQALEQHSSGAQAAGDLEAWDSIDDAEETAEAEAARQQAALEARHLSDLQQQQQLEAAAAAAAAAAAGQQQQQQQGGDEELPALHPDPAVAAAVAAHIAAQQALPRRTGPSLYAANLTAVDIHGRVVHTAELEGHVTLVVNVASHCGFTESNYKGLVRLYERYREFGLEVLAFPCNQFGHQESGSHAEIEAFARQHRATFPLMAKTDVNGPSQHPIFAWLKQHTPPEPGHQEGEDIAWNFAKFLLDKHGHPVKRYGSELDYHSLELDCYNELIKLH